MNIECKRCGACCQNAYISMENIKLGTKQGKDFSEWLYNYGLEVITNGEVPLIKFPFPCKHLNKIGDKYECLIYDTRPEICRKHWCQTMKKEREILDKCYGEIINDLY